MARRRVAIMGAAGRDFHVFNMLCREDAQTEVVAFTATQIPGIAGRRYPAALAGRLYPEGIPILPEDALAVLIREARIGRVIFAYSDVSHAHVMERASEVVAAGAEFVLPGAAPTMLEAPVPVIAVCAVRTGCGKSQVARYLSGLIRERGLRAAVLRHPMPYGALAAQAVQRFASLEDLRAADCTVEEREEYEPHIAAGNVVFAGVDYARIMEAASREADLILWDGGNNDLPFLRPDWLVVLVDPLRPGHETGWHPGEVALRMADLVLVAKTNAADPGAVMRVMETARSTTPGADLVRGASVTALDRPDLVTGRRVLIVEDGPTLTHGGMSHGAGLAAVRAAGGLPVDPRKSAAPTIAEVYAAWPHIGPVLPAVGYDAEQLEALGETIAASEAETVVIATPCDLSALIAIRQPVARVRYDYAEADDPPLSAHLDRALARLLPPAPAKAD